MQFSDLDLIPELLRAVEWAGYKQPSPIQEKAIPIVLSGRDLLGCAQTGSGKTAAFSLPIINMLAKNHIEGDHSKIRALILAPTRELAVQIDECIKTYTKFLDLRCGVILGGVGQKPQEKMLSDGVDILIATPGRLWDLYKQKLVKFDSVEIFVLDEADRMLDMGFIHDVRRIAGAMPEKKQTLLFSATMPDEVMKLIDSLLVNYESAMVDPVSSTVDTIDQRVYFVDTVNKHKLLMNILRDEEVPYALVFTRTKHGADVLTRRLTKAGIKSRAIHGDKSQNSRQEALKSFKNGKIQVLVATEIAARGIDIDGLPYVFNYNMPEEAEMYVHRIGRTGRAGASGSAISLCNYEEQPILYDIEKLIGHKIPVVTGHGFPMSDFTVKSSNGGAAKPAAAPISSGSFAPPTVSKFPKSMSRPRRPRSFKKMR